jgi:hypothetical protein
MTTSPADFLDPSLIEHLQETRKAAAKASVHIDTPIPDSEVRLPGGYYNPLTGETTKVAEVRELNGFDEEALSRAKTPAHAMLMLLKRAVVRIGDNDNPTDQDIDALLMGDRNQLLVGIRIATWGSEVRYEDVTCPHCAHLFTIAFDLNTDLPQRTLESSADQTFEVELRKGIATISLPTGIAQRRILTAEGKTTTELNSILLEECVQDINGVPVLDPKTIKSLGSADRQTILEAIAERNPGPLLDEVKEACPECSEDINYPLTVMSLFPLW